MPLVSFLRWVSDRAGVSVVADSKLDQTPVTLDVINEQISDVLGMVARRMGVQVTRTGNLYYLGTLRPEDRGVLVRRCRRLTSADLSAAVAVLLSENGRAHAYDDGLLVVGDRVEVLQRVHELLDRIESSASVCWCIQLYLVSLGNSDLTDLGLDVEPTLNVAYTFATASNSLGAASAASSAVKGATLNGGLSAILKAAKQRKGVAIQAEPLFTLIDGGEAEFIRGDKVPVPKSITTQNGFVETAGFDYVQTGLDVHVGIRELSDDAARFKTSVKISEVTGQVSTAPITSDQSFDAESVIHSGGVYLLGSLKRSEVQHTQSSSLKWGDTKQVDNAVLQVWCRAYRVGRLVDEGRSEVVPACPTAGHPEAGPAAGPAEDPRPTWGGPVQPLTTRR